MYLYCIVLVLCAALCGALFRRLRTIRRRARKLESALEGTMIQLEQLQNAFSRFAPHTVVEDIIQRGVSTRAERREVTVLFCDIRNFTAVSETMDPERLVQMLNVYFRQMSETLSVHRGHVSKFIGDGIMALFGAPDTNPWQSMDAVMAALSMRAALGQLNAQLNEQGLPPISIGIGIHRGPVVAGVIGSRDLLEYTVIGDIVNTAARIESLTRKHQTDILISGDVARLLDDRFMLEEKPTEPLKGKSEPVQVFAVERMASG